MAETEIQNSEKQTLYAGSERGFHEMKLAFLRCGVLVREDLSD